MKKIKNWWRIAWTIIKGLLRFANPQAVEIIDETIDEVNNELNGKEVKKWKKRNNVKYKRTVKKLKMYRDINQNLRK